jgi:hypothetical protein
LKSSRQLSPGDTKIKPWYDGLFKSGLAMSATAGPIRAFSYCIATPQIEIDLIKARLKQAEEHYRQWKEGMG